MLVVPAAAQAEDGYGMAGCGLGSMLFGAKAGFVQVFAATTNNTSGSQTFGISSGTSNCDKGPGGSASAKAFVEVNREALAKDVARGQGETLQSLVAIAGCVDAAAVGRRLQGEFATVFPDAAVPSADVANSVVGVLQRDTALACGRLDTEQG